MENVTTSDLADIRLRTNTLRTPRGRATRVRIREATRTLIASGSLINVKEIAAAASVSRSTFYSHYAHLDELAVDILSENLLAQPFSVDALVDAYVENRDFYRITLQETGSRAVLETAARIATESLLDRRGEEPSDDRARHERLALFTAWGYIGTLDEWLRSPDPESPDDLKRFLHDRTPMELRLHTS